MKTKLKLTRKEHHAGGLHALVVTDHKVPGRPDSRTPFVEVVQGSNPFWGATTSTSNSNAGFVDSIMSRGNRTAIPNIWHAIRSIRSMYSLVLLVHDRDRHGIVCEQCAVRSVPAENIYQRMATVTFD
jgi:hypothetical protein